MSNDDLSDLASRCEQAIGYEFTDTSLLTSALTHASRADTRLRSNERLEFLGDAILGAVVCARLYHAFPDLLEGDLTKIKSVVVSRRTCARISRHLELGRFLRLGKGMSASGAIPSSLLADVFESLTAAIYLDGGMEAASRFILAHVDAEIERVASGHHGGNYKSALQQVAQREFAQTPSYQTLDERGPDHAKCFEIAASIGLRHFPSAWGRSKKEAEQKAAQNALDHLRAQGILSDEDVSEEMGDGGLEEMGDGGQDDDLGLFD